MDSNLKHKNMKKIHSLINGINVIEPHNIFFNKYDPTNSNLIYEVQVCSKNLLNKSISDAENAFEIWNKISSIKRGEILFSFVDLIKQNKWQWGKKILIIHTGGLQGVKGMNLQLQKKGKPHLVYGKELPF